MKTSKKKKIFVISSSAFETLEKAKRQILEWERQETLHSDATIYEVSNIYDIFIETVVNIKKR